MNVNHESITGYQIGALIGRGRYTYIYQAEQTSFSRRVAIKVLSSEIADHAEYIRHFEDYRTIARLKHHNIVPLYDYWREPASAYFVMPLYAYSLADALKKGVLSLERTSDVIMQIGDALMLTHRYGILHHNIKPSNILFDLDNIPHLSDFHIIPDIRITDLDSEFPVTQSYYPPEQRRGMQLSRQSDIYSLALLAFEMLTGTTDLSGDSSAVHPAILAVIRQATKDDPAQRYPDVASFLEAFQQALPDNVSTPADELERVASTALNKFIKGSTGIRWRIKQDLEKRIQNPYKGLSAFEEEDAGNFFGREAMTELLVQKLGGTGELSRFLAVVGPSGSGKSSLIKAGLILALRRGVLPDSDKWFIAEMMPKAQPLHELRATLLSIARTKSPTILEQLQSSDDGLTQVIQSIFAGSDEILIFIDQFEEIFTMTESSVQANQFMNLLYAAVTAPDSRIRVIITLRADFYDRPLLHPRFCDLIAQRTVIVPPLTINELHRSIVNPLNSLDMTMEDELVSTIIDDVNEQPGTLPMLQYALTQLFERRDGDTLTLANYQEIGGILGALTRQADELFNRLTPAQQTAARQMFLRLVTLGEGTEDTRKQALQSELLSLGGEAMADVFSVFGDSRLITFNNDSVTREPTVEVAHEALIQRWALLRQWLDNSRSDLRQQKQLENLAKEWLNSGKDTSFLASGSRLDQLENWFTATTLSLSDHEQDYVNASLAERDRRNDEKALQQENKRRLELRARRLLQALTVASVLGALVAIVLSLFAFSQSYEASVARQESEINAQISNELTMLSNSQLLLYRDNNTDLALALALETLNLNYLPEQEFRNLTETMYAPGTRMVISGHEGRIYESDLSNDKSRIVTGSNDNTVRIWDVATGEELQRFEGHEGSVMQVTFSPDNRLVASASLDGTVRIWDVETGETLNVLNGDGDPNGFLAVEFSPDGQQVASGSQNNTVQFWDVQTGELLNTLGVDDPNTDEIEGHSNWVWGVTFNQDATRLMSGGRDGLGLLWDIETGEVLQVFPHTDIVYQLKFSDDEQAVYTASADKTAKLWDIETGDVLLSLEGHTSAVYSVVLNAERTQALTASQDGTVRLWDLSNSVELNRFIGHSDRVFDARYLADQRQFISSSYDGTMRVWDIETPQSLNAVETDPTGTVIYSVEIDSAGKRIVTASGNSTVSLWDTGTLENIMTFPVDDPATDAIEGHSNIVLNASFSPDGSQIISSDGNAMMLLWDIASADIIHDFPVDDLTTEDIEGHIQGRMIWDTAFSPDGKTVYSAGFDNRVIQWDAETGELIHVYEGHENSVLGVIPLSDGKRFLSFSWDNTIILWDNETYENVRVYNGHTDRVWSLAISPDEKTFVTASEDATMIQWDIETGAIVKQFFGHEDAVLSIHFSTDGQWLVSSGRDNLVLMWSIEAGEWLRQFVGHRDWVRSIDYYPQGNLFITGDNEGVMRLWQAQDIDEIKQWAYENRYVKPFTCEERELYRVQPLCELAESEE